MIRLAEMCAGHLSDSPHVVVHVCCSPATVILCKAVKMWLPQSTAAGGCRVETTLDEHSSEDEVTFAWGVRAQYERHIENSDLLKRLG